MATVSTAPDLEKVFKALSSSARRDALQMLAETAAQDGECCALNEVCACKISDRLGLSASTVSHHMSVLQDAGLISSRKDGLWVYYSVRRDALHDVAGWLSGL